MGVPVGLRFKAADCAPENAWTKLAFHGAPLLTGAGNITFASTQHDGQLVVLMRNNPGDCNADSKVDAGDFPATVLELFDVESTDVSGTLPLPSSWLWTPKGAYAFSARGCDSNDDRTLEVSDLQCTVRRFFGKSCSAGGVQAADAQAPAVVSAPGKAWATSGAVAAVPLLLETNNHDVAAFAASIVFDPARLRLDPADADRDGVPDAVHFHLPPGMYRAAAYDTAAGRVDLVAAGVAKPLPKLVDGQVVTLDLTIVDDAESAAALALANLSLGDSEGGAVPVAAGTTGAEAPGGRMYLPAVMQ
jgi:hypothetical protein